MAFCGKCGAQLAEGAKFCPQCGAQTAQTQSEQPGQQAQGQQDWTQQAQQTFNNFNNTANTTGEFDPQDIQRGKGIAWLSYLGILFLIPLFGSQNSKFCRYHANQGLVLLIFEIAYWIAFGIISGIFLGIAYATFSIGLITVWNVISTILRAVGSIWMLVFIILGIVNAANGQAKELPIIGGIKIIK
jgi:uncharacterized membrane protein